MFFSSPGDVFCSFEEHIHGDLPSVVECVTRELLFALKVTVDPDCSLARRCLILIYSDEGSFLRNCQRHADVGLTLALIFHCLVNETRELQWIYKQGRDAAAPQAGQL